MECHGISYVHFWTKVIDCLINLQDKKCDSPDRHNNDTGYLVINTPDSQTMARLKASENTVNQEIIQDNRPKENKTDLMTPMTP